MKSKFLFIACCILCLSCSSTKKSPLTEVKGSLHLQTSKRIGENTNVRCKGPEYLNVNYVLEDSGLTDTLIYTAKHAPLKARKKNRNLLASYTTDDHSQKLTFIPFSEKEVLLSVEITSKVAENTLCEYQYSGKLPKNTTG